MKISSLNLCLGIKNKIETIRQTKEIISSDIIFFQETELSENDIECSYSIAGFKSYPSLNKPKSRLCSFVKNNINHRVLCAQNLELTKIETKDIQVFGLYRPFKIAENRSYQSYLQEITEWIKSNLSINKHIVIIGDLNLDYSQRLNTSHRNFNLLQQWITFTDCLSLTQTVTDHTWSRTINDSVKTSLLDHIYTSELETKTNTIDVNISDHMLISIELNSGNEDAWEEKRILRNWERYNKTDFINLIEIDPARFEPMTVNEHEDFLGLTILLALNKIAPEKKSRLHKSDPLYSPKIDKLKQSKAALIKKARRTTTNCSTKKRGC